MYIMYIFIQYKCAYRVLGYRNSVSSRIGTALPVHIIQSDSENHPSSSSQSSDHPSKDLSPERKARR